MTKLNKNGKIFKNRLEGSKSMAQVQKKHIEFVDKTGLPFSDEKLPENTREQIVQNVFTTIMHDQDEVAQFINSAVQYLPDEKLNIQDGKIQLDLSSPEFQNFTILYATQKVMDQALDENLIEAYNLLTEYTGSTKYTGKDTISLDEDDLKELEEYYSPTPELQLAQKVCNIQMQINETMSGQSGKCFTSFQANRIQELFEDMMPYLNFEQRAAAYYNVSLIHRALLAEKDYYDPAENNSEKECLKKVLEYTVDYKRINYCANRLGTSFTDQGMLRAAYRRALAAAETENDLCKINLALAACYKSDYHPKIGFRYENHPEQEHEDQKLERAERHYADALRYASDPEKLSILKEIGKLQKKQSKLSDWTETQTQIAMKYMTGEERCHALMNIAEHNARLRVPYLERVVYEAARSKEMSKASKSTVIQKAAKSLRPIYEKEKNEAALEKLNKTALRFEKASAKDNPLLKFKRKSSEM